MRKYTQTEFRDLHGSTCGAQFVSPAELSAYIDKELPAWKRRLIRGHLKKCGICANQVERLQHTDDFLRRSGEIKVSDDFLSGVMAHVSEATQYQRPYASLWSHVTHFIGSSLGWARYSSTLADRLRYSIRTRSPVYIFVLTFAVFTMVGATLYQSSNDRFGPSIHRGSGFPPTQSQQLDGEKLISFEVIQHEPPKRLLTTYLSQPSAASGQPSAR